MLKAHMTVASKKDREEREEHPFIFEVVVTHHEADRKIDDAFYKTYAADKKVPEGVHYEMKIISPPDLMDHPLREKLFIHHSTKTAGVFIAWPDPITRPEVAKQILKAWCLGAVYILSGKEYEPLYEKHHIKERDARALLKLSGILEYLHNLMLSSRSFNAN